MPKEFNVTGTCIPSRHFMADTSEKLAQTMKMVEMGRYFIINRPRQYGKTTTFSLLVSLLEQEGFLVVRMSFEGLGDTVFESERAFAKRFVELLAEKTSDTETPLKTWMNSEHGAVEDMGTLSDFIAGMVERTPRRIVVMIDEVDKSSNNQLFLHFLGMLRQKFLDAAEGADKTFHSVILAGVHDVKSLKLKLRPGEEQKYNSPWNIASDFNVEMSLLPHETVPMLEDFSRERGVVLDAKKIADLLFFYTSGYPFLVSKLCKIFDETLLPRKTEKTFTEDDVEMAVEKLITEENTNFENVAKNLENNPELYRLTAAVVIEGKTIPFDALDPIINLGVLHGIYARNGKLAVHNRIYREIIFNYMTLRLIRQQIAEGKDTQDEGAFSLPDKTLDMESLLLRFQDLMKEEYSQKDRDFLERQGRLVFLSFLKPILNGNGHAFKEPQISEERRLDIIVSYFKNKYLIELKIWRGEKAHQKGILQLAEYLERQNLDRGYLVVFDHSATKTWAKKRIRKAGKKIFAVWV